MTFSLRVVFLLEQMIPFFTRQPITMITRPKGLLDPKIRDEMSDFLEIFPTENQI